MFLLITLISVCLFNETVCSYKCEIGIPIVQNLYILHKLSILLEVLSPPPLHARKYSTRKKLVSFMVNLTEELVQKYIILNILALLLQFLQVTSHPFGVHQLNILLVIL